MHASYPQVNGIMDRATATKERVADAKLESDVQAGTATLTQLEAAAAAARVDLPEAEVAEQEGLGAAVRASLEDQARRRAEEARAQAAAAEAERRPQGRRTPTGELENFRWQLVRSKGHPVYKRQVIMRVMGGKYSLTTQTTTISSTPSDRRSSANAVADINRLNDDVSEIFDLDTEVHGVMESRLSALKSKEAQLCGSSFNMTLVGPCIVHSAVPCPAHAQPMPGPDEPYVVCSF